MLGNNVTAIFQQLSTPNQTIPFFTEFYQQAFLHSVRTLFLLDRFYVYSNNRITIKKCKFYLFPLSKIWSNRNDSWIMNGVPLTSNKLVFRVRTFSCTICPLFAKSVKMLKIRQDIRWGIKKFNWIQRKCVEKNEVFILPVCKRFPPQNFFLKFF